MPKRVHPTGVERTFNPGEFIVTKTDTKGRITYANDVFLRLSAFTLDEVIGQPHNIVRHPDVPRGVYKLLWDSITHGHEVFAYVNNLASDGANYWVFAHITPNFDHDGRITGYHSNRRPPSPKEISAVKPLYQKMMDIERTAGGATQATSASHLYLQNHISDRGHTYDSFVWDIHHQAELAMK